MTTRWISLPLRRGLMALCFTLVACALPSTAVAGPLCADIFVDDDPLADDPFDTGDGDGSGGDGIICRDFIAGQNNAAFYYFDVGDEAEHLLRVTVDFVQESFGLAVQRIFHPEGNTFGITGYTCLAYGRDGQCVEYQTLNNPVEGVDYSGDVTWLIAWTPPIGTRDGGEIIHAPGDSDVYSILTEGKFFDDTVGPPQFSCDNPYTDQCFSTDAFKAGDPVRAALSDNFSSAVVVERSVPEPGTLALLGLGVAGYVLRRRR